MFADDNITVFNIQHLTFCVQRSAMRQSLIIEFNEFKKWSSHLPHNFSDSSDLEDKQHKWSSNKPFLNYLWPLFQSKSWWSSFHMKIGCHSHANKNLFSYERMSIRIDSLWKRGQRWFRNGLFLVLSMHHFVSQVLHNVCILLTLIFFAEIIDHSVTLYVS